MNRNRFYSEINQENRSKRDAIKWSFFLLILCAVLFTLILIAPTSKKIIGPIEDIKIKYL